MLKTEVTLKPLSAEDREQFILDNQWSFKYGAMLEFGERDNHVDDDGEIISRRTIEQALDEENNQAYRIMLDGEKVGGMIVKIDKESGHNHLEILFVAPKAHSRGIGYGAWQALEALYPETKIWETCTPYFEKRNIHFYVNKCGFHIVEFYNAYNGENAASMEEPNEGPDEMFRFIKVMKE